MELAKLKRVRESYELEKLERVWAEIVLDVFRDKEGHL